MNSKQLTAGVILVVFSAFSAYVVYQYGYVGLFEQALANAATIQVFLDLTIALSLVIVWMWQDAQKQDIAPLPYALLTLTLGSIGPLLYLVRRLGKDAPLFSRPHTARL
jgi:flagellar biogenesis protein FliO